MDLFSRAFIAATASFVFLSPLANAMDNASIELIPPPLRITCDGVRNTSSGEVPPAFRVEILIERREPSPSTERRWRLGYNIRPGQKVLAVTAGEAKLQALEGHQATLIATSRGLSGAHESMEILPNSSEEKQGRLRLGFDLIETGAKIPGGGRLLQLELWPFYEVDEQGDLKISTGKQKPSGMGIIKAYGNKPPVEDPYSLVHCTRQEVY